MTMTGQQRLSGSWTHSFEEDSGDEQVFRPSAGFAFPPSRRPRDTLDFSTEQMTSRMPGPDDRVHQTTSTMAPAGENRVVANGRELEVIEVRSDLLRVRSK